VDADAQDVTAMRSTVWGGQSVNLELPSTADRFSNPDLMTEVVEEEQGKKGF